MIQKRKNVIFMVVVFLLFFNCSVQAKSNISWDDNNENKEIDLSDKICFDDQCFYVISNEDGFINMLTEYNLYVGGKYPAQERVNNDDSKWIPYGEELTGLQDPNMLGYQENIADYYEGTLSYSDNCYWENEKIFPVYVFNENSKLFSYVHNYETYLKEKSEINGIEATLLTFEQALSLGCVNSFTAVNSCENAPEWLYSTSYWLGTAYGDRGVFHLSSSANLSGVSWGNSLFGVRPVVKVREEDLPIFKIDIIPSLYGTIKTNRESSFYGNDIIYTIEPKDGYILDYVSIIDANGNKIIVYDNVFKMPSANVKIEAYFIPLSNPYTKRFIGGLVFIVSVLGYLIYFVSKNKNGVA